MTTSRCWHLVLLPPFPVSCQDLWAEEQSHFQGHIPFFCALTLTHGPQGLCLFDSPEDQRRKTLNVWQKHGREKGGSKGESEQKYPAAAYNFQISFRNEAIWTGRNKGFFL